MADEKLIMEMNRLRKERDILRDRIYEIRDILDRERKEKLEEERKKLIGKCFVFSPEGLSVSDRRSYTYSRYSMPECSFRVLHPGVPDTYDAECLVVDENGICIKKLPLFAPVASRLIITQAEAQSTYIRNSREISREEFSTLFEKTTEKLKSCLPPAGKDGEKQDVT